MSSQSTANTEPWMRGTHQELDVVRRAVVHALEMALEDAERWAAPLNSVQMFARPAGVASVAFHLRHIARSLDRLLTYAEDRVLSEEQLSALRAEMEPGDVEEVLAEFRDGIRSAMERVHAFDPAQYEKPRGIGRKRLPTTVGGVLIHAAEHTQRHVGQMVLTCKLVSELHS